MIEGTYNCADGCLVIGELVYFCNITIENDIHIFPADLFDSTGFNSYLQLDPEDAREIAKWIPDDGIFVRVIE